MIFAIIGVVFVALGVLLFIWALIRLGYALTVPFWSEKKMDEHLFNKWKKEKDYKKHEKNMKNLIIVVLLFSITNVVAQLKVTDTNKPETIGMYKMGGVEYVEIKKDGDNAFFVYKDITYQHLNLYKTFLIPYNDLNIIYELFANVDGFKKGESKTVELNDTEKLVFEYQNNKPTVYHYTGNDIGMFAFMSSKKLDKLFGL